MAKLQITYSKSTIGFSKDQKTTVRSLGLRKLNSVVLKADTPSIRGMIFKVQHLVSVEEVADDAVLTQHADKPKTTFVRTSEDALPMKARPARPAPMPAAAAPVSEAAPSAPRRASKPRAAAPVEVEAAEPAVVETVAPAAVETVEAAEPAVVETVAPAAMETVEADSVAPAVVETVETEAEPTAQMNVAEVIAPVDTAAPEQSSGDDLTLVEGIGPKVASMLQDAGITTFAQLADAEVEQLRAMLDDADLSMVVPTTWPEQARLAADGRMDELDQFKSELQAGRSQ